MEEWCPGCRGGQPVESGKVVIVHCEMHNPGYEGSEDVLVPAGILPSGVSEAGGESNRLWCDFFEKRGKWKKQ